MLLLSKLGPPMTTNICARTSQHDHRHCNHSWSSRICYGGHEIQLQQKRIQIYLGARSRQNKSIHTDHRLGLTGIWRRCHCSHSVDRQFAASTSFHSLIYHQRPHYQPLSRGGVVPIRSKAGSVAGLPASRQSTVDVFPPGPLSPWYSPYGTFKPLALDNLTEYLPRQSGLQGPNRWRLTFRSSWRGW